MSRFNFIADQDLAEAVSKVLAKAERAGRKADEEFEKNVLDPFAALFSLTYNDITLEEWNEQERERQTQKSIQNAIGEFHQDLLGRFNGWKDPGRGGSVDLVNDNRKIIAEIKNKHNTMNSSAAMQTYNKLANHLQYDRKGYTAYLVQIIPKSANGYDVKWSPNHTTAALREDIRKMDGETFYDLASGEKDTLERIFKAIPEVVATILEKPAIDPTILEQCNKLFLSVYK